MVPEPSLLISMVIGDYVHNVRSALDHLWKRLGAGGNFPMFQDAHEWSKKRDKKLVGVHSEAHAIIDSVQPCSGPSFVSSHSHLEQAL
jgi:hypothetical protein